MMKRAYWLTFPAVSVLLACAQAGGQSAPPPVQRETLKIAAGINEAYAQLYVAEEEGYFNDAGLDVQIINPTTSFTPFIVSGQADLGMSGSTAGLSPVGNGQDMSIIYNFAGGGFSGVVYGLPKVKSISDCTRVGTYQIGSSAYAWAVVYKKLFNGKWDIVQFATTTLIPALTSGNIDCISGSLLVFYQQAASGAIHKLVDPKDASTLPPGTVTSDFNYSETSIWGVKSTIQGKRAAIERFLKAYQRALPLVRHDTGRQLAQIMRKDQRWLPFPEDTLAQSVATATPYNAPYDGYLPSSIWPQTLNFFVAGGASFIDPIDPKWNYQHRVDMSYYENAIGKPKNLP